MLILTVGKEEPRMSGFAEINGINDINGKCLKLLLKVGLRSMSPVASKPPKTYCMF